MNEVESYRFGAFELHARTRQLLRDGEVVSIQPKPLELLLYLIARRDRVVPRQEMVEAVWSDAHVNPEAVSFVVHALRRAVGDDGRRQAVIRTLQRTGFRFVAPVEEVRVVAPEAAMSPPASGAFPGPAFVGRAHLLGVGQALLGEVQTGAGGRVLLVSGEAGIGKTRVLERLTELAEGQGFRVLLGRCVESEGAPAFWPWVQVLRAAVSEDPPPGLLRVLAEGAREVAWLMPELLAYVRELPEAPTLEPRTARFLMCDAVVTFLRELSAERPYVLCFDDLHRADAASLAVLRHVAQELGGLRLAILGSYREAELRASVERSEAMAGVASLAHSRHEPLRGFDAAEVGTMVHDLSGHKASETVVSDLHEKTGGNPFFVDQILRVLGSEGRLAELESEGSLELSLPPHAQEAIRRQVALLPEASRSLMELASVVGRDFRVAELEGASGLSRAEVLAQLKAPLEAGILRPESRDPNLYRFAHVLVCDAIYAGLPIDRRAPLHARVGHAIARLCGEDPGPRSAELAHHFAGSDAEDLGRAIHYARQAARWASERGAVEEAPIHLEQALRLLDQRPSDERLRCEILIQYGDALTQNSRRGAARAALMEAARIAKRHDDAERLARAALRYAPDLLAIDSGRVDWDLELARLLEESIERLTEASPLRGRLLARLAVLVNWSESEEKVRALCDAAAVSAEASGDEAATLFVDTACRFARYRVDDASGNHSLSSVGIAGEEATELQRFVLRLTAMMQLGIEPGLDDQLASFGALADRTRQPLATWWVELFRSTRALSKGDYVAWERHAHRYLRLGNDLQDSNAVISHRVQLMVVGFDRLNSRLKHDLEEMVRSFPRIEAWLSALAAECCELGHLDDARENVARAVDAGTLDPPRRQEWFGTNGALAIAARRLGDADVAERICRNLAPFAGQFAIIGFGSAVWGAVDRFLGLAAAASGRDEEAVEHLRAAIRLNESLGAAPALAHSCFELAVLLEERGDPGVSEARARSAKLARRLGMDRLETKLRERWPS